MNRNIPIALLATLLFSQPALALKPRAFSLEKQQASFALGADVSGTSAFHVPRSNDGLRFMKLPGQKTFMPLNRVARRVVEERGQPELPLSPRGQKQSTLGWPVAKDAGQWISSPFGWRDDPYTKEQAFHAGVDIAVPVGTTVRATSAGEVTGIGTHPRLGRYVKITHAGDEETYSLYGHLKGWDVKQGDTVRLGEKIGEVGMTGRTTGAHLDYSLRREGKPVDPMKYLSVPNKLKGLEVSALK